MTNELEIFTAAASIDTFIYLSAVFALGYAAFALWLIGTAPPQQKLPASLVRRAS